MYKSVHYRFFRCTSLYTFSHEYRDSCRVARARPRSSRTPQQSSERLLFSCRITSLTTQHCRPATPPLVHPSGHHPTAPSDSALRITILPQVCRPARDRRLEGHTGDGGTRGGRCPEDCRKGVQPAGHGPQGDLASPLEHSHWSTSPSRRWRATVSWSIPPSDSHDRRRQVGKLAAVSPPCPAA